MNSIILTTTTRFMISLLLVFSIFLLLRGHNEPGGGFIGGLVGAASFALYALAYSVDAARKTLAVDPRTLIGYGLLAATLAGLIAYVGGDAFLTGLWLHAPMPVIGKLGTTLLFDVGVYLVVVGFTLHIIFTLAEEA